MEELHKLQESEGLHLANKLHAALSLSVTDALEYFESKLKLPQVEYIRKFDRLFDVLNSKNPLARNFKAPIRKSMYAYTKFLDKASQYIPDLKTSDGKSILASRRKTEFIGFLVCINSVCGLLSSWN